MFAGGAAVVDGAAVVGVTVVDVTVMGVLLVLLGFGLAAVAVVAFGFAVVFGVFDFVVVVGALTVVVGADAFVGRQMMRPA